MHDNSRTMKSRTALIAGSTGLVGGLLLDLLLDDPTYARVIAITRRPLENKEDKLVNIVLDFQKLDEHSRDLMADDVFCCLGTTIKKAGTKEKFREVDYEYPLKLAQLCKANGAQQFLLVTALGANKNTTIFYNRVKGEVEEAIDKLGLEAYHIFRPALLMGSRHESRSGEDAAKNFFKIFGFLFVGPLKQYRAIDAIKVARAMQQIARKNIAGTHIHESRELQNY